MKHIRQVGPLPFSSSLLCPEAAGRPLQNLVKLIADAVGHVAGFPDHVLRVTCTLVYLNLLLETDWAGEDTKPVVGAALYALRLPDDFPPSALRGLCEHLEFVNQHTFYDAKNKSSFLPFPFLQ